MSIEQIFDFRSDADCLGAISKYTSLMLMAHSTIFCKYRRKFHSIDSETDALKLAKRDIREMATEQKFIRIISKPITRHQSGGILVFFKIVVILILK